MKKIVIAGGTGFLGKILADHYITQGNQVIILSRNRRSNQGNLSYVHWDGETLGDWKCSIEGANVLINLCGKSVDCRYNERNKKLIYDTRIKSTSVLGEAMNSCQKPPKIWLNASSATIYRHAEDREMDEETGEMGSGFSVDVCQKWENAFFDTQVQNVRQVALRIAIVLGKNGGALEPLKRLAQIGLGGRQGSGNQFFSWIHEDDFIAAVDYIIQNPTINGAINLSSPNPIINQEFMKSLRKAVGSVVGFPLYKWMLEFGAVLIRTETELILKSRRVVPKKLLDAGFQFKYPKIQETLNNLLVKSTIS